jgi:hypothetical protein
MDRVDTYYCETPQDPHSHSLLRSSVVYGVVLDREVLRSRVMERRMEPKFGKGPRKIWVSGWSFQCGFGWGLRSG